LSLLLAIKNNKLRFTVYSLLSSLLFTFSFLPFGFFPLAYLGFIPLLFLEKECRNNASGTTLDVFIFSWLAFIGWTGGTIWWIWNASNGGAIAAVLINSFPMILPVLLLHLSGKKNNRANYNLFIFAWLAIEILQFNWDLAFPWLILGNVFSSFTNGVQWYEYTGILGGSFLILIVNTKLFKWIEQYKEGNFIGKELRLFNILFIYIFCPILGSYFILENFKDYKKNNAIKTANVLIVQPNIDPYSEKFNGIGYQEQLNKMFELAEKKLNAKTQLVVFPETALLGGLYEQELEQDYLIKSCKQFLSKHPGLMLLTGADTYRTFDPNDIKKPITARFYPSVQQCIDAYNTALLLAENNPIQVYHKNKMVPGVERMPYPVVFGFLEQFAIDLGGTSGSLGADGESKVFDNKHHINIAPVICYESVFPDFFSSYKLKGADLYCIITNDGWWGNTPGFRQHLNYAKLRAIENRTPIVRCANTGISAFINDEGEITQQTDWWVPAVIESQVSMHAYNSFYGKNASMIHAICLFIFVLQVLKLGVQTKF
jgi:apolipoprotein N-acyltransferase